MGKKCKHFWTLAGAQGNRWKAGHAMARCTNCPAWTVVEYGDDKPGPCQHVVAKEKRREKSEEVPTALV